MTKMEVSSQILSDITTFMKYARWDAKKERRETYREIVTRNKKMHLDRFPKLNEEIEEAYKAVYNKELLPSMRSFQFAGKPIELNNARLYNCCFMPVDHYAAFGELMFLLLSGCGVGYSVQTHHVEKLPEVVRPTKTQRFLIGDSIEGWSDAIKVLVRAYLDNKPLPIFDFGDIREKGARLKTSGGKAPGPEPLKEGLQLIQNIFDRKKTGERLTTLEVHDIICHIADTVLSGGIRRSAMIALFNVDDDDMLTCKFGDWYVENPQRGRANNSAVIVRHRIDEEVFFELWKKVQFSQSGEPGFFFTNDAEWGLNPCKPLNSLILTDTGYITFEQALKLPSLRVVLGDGRIVNATKPFKTGQNRSVYRITLSNGMFLYGTENHKHQLVSGDWKRIDELNIQDRLKFSAPSIHLTQIDNNDEYNSGILHGWLITDGWNFKRGDSKYSNRAGIVLGQNEFDLQPFFEALLKTKAKNHPQRPTTAKLLYVKQQLIDKDFSKTSFDWIRNKSSSFKMGLLRAAFTADGSVRKNNNCELYSINRTFLETLQTVLLEFGVRASIHVHNNPRVYVANDGKTRNNALLWKLNVYAGQFKRIGMLSEKKQQLLNQQDDCSLYRRIDYETIVDIEPEWSKEDVYDITVDDETHSFLDTGVVAHNCAEISLRPFQFCNVVTIHAGTIKTQEELNTRAKCAAFIATLQAAYTDFHYLRDIWKKTTEKEALIGVSLAGIASGTVLTLNLKEAAAIIKEENQRVANLIGINPAARTTTVKPDGCLTLDTKIKTTEGIKSMAEVTAILTSINIFETEENWIEPQSSLFIYNENNEPEKISKLYVNGMSPVFEIETDDGCTIKITPEHKLKTIGGWKRAKDLVEGDDITGF